MHQDTLHRVALSRVPKVGPILSRLLFNHFGSAEAVFSARPRELQDLPGIGKALIDGLALDAPVREAEYIVRFAEEHGIRIFHFSDPDFPTRFHQQSQSPALFYYRGTQILNLRRTIAIVGTRKPTDRGIRHTEVLLSGLATYQPLIISGLAYGIDICAHREALKHGLPTLGVLGSGLDQIYPGSHWSVARKMMDNGGLLTAYPHFITPEREHFPARNRLVAHLADAVVVMESEARGGSIITANMGLEAGKVVGAFPGRFDDLKSAGCNLLVKQGGAHLIESAEDLARILGWHSSEPGGQQGTLFEELNETERQIITALDSADDLAIDELGRKLEWPSGQLAGQLLSMECKGLIKVLPGHRYRLAY